jgi:hypothetical protein
MKQTLLFLSFVLISFNALAQVTTSNISGLVTDSKGEPLPGVNVVAVHTPSGTNYGAITNFDGRFNLHNLRVGGPYTVTVSYVGFKTQTLDSIFLTLGKTYNLEIKLLENTEELDAVVIKGSSGKGIFGDDRTGAETNVGRRELTTLPTISRSAEDFTRLEPTASNGSFGGRNDQFNNFSLDGAIFNNPFGLDAATPGGQTDSQPVSLDAIEQIQVSTAPYDVRQSGFTGATVNAVTKSGTNTFHGTVFGFYRNQDLTGNKIKGDKIFVPKLTQNQYGASIGGPIIKNKLFFFANFEKDEREDLGQSWLPNRGTGAINESRVDINDLLLVQNLLSQVVIGQDDQGNPIYYNPGSFEGFIHNTESTKGIFKLDWNINDSNRLAVIYNFLDASKDKPAHPTALGFRGPSASTLQFQNAGYQINNELNSIQLELNSDLDGASNKMQFGYTHFNDFRNPFSTPAPSITITKDGSNYIIAGHEPFSIHNRLDQKVIQFSDNLSFFKGNHTYTVGFSFEKFMFDNSFNLGVYGAQGVFFPTSSIEDFQSLADSGQLQSLFNDAIAADSALNAAGEGNPGGWSLAETNVGQMAFYAQDEWNVTDKLKLTIGVRADKPLYFDTSKKAQNVIDNSCCVVPDIPYVNPNTGETVFIDNTKMPTNQWLISPRLGFNYDAGKGENPFQLRGGTGIFTGRLPFVWLGNQVSSPNVFFLQAVDPDFKFPQVWRTNIGVDKKLDNGLIVTADLAYTKDINGAHVQNWGLLSPSGNLNGVDNRPVYLDSDKINNAYVFTNSDKGRIWNASLKLQKNFTNGLYTMLAYSYLNSKDVNSIEAEITGDAFAFNPVVGDANKDVLSYSKYGDTHRIIGVASKKWNYGNDKWATTISTFFEYARGGRFSYTYGGDLNGDGSGLNDLLYIPTQNEINQMQFSGAGQAEAFNTFIEQDDYLSDHRGEYAERYGALSPWRSRVDLKLLQDFNFNFKEGKKQTIQFSVDILNVGNLINSDWGLVQQPNNVQPLGVSVDPNTLTPTYTFNPDLKDTFGYDASLASRWQMQFGLRYIF